MRTFFDFDLIRDLSIFCIVWCTLAIFVIFWYLPGKVSFSLVFWSSAPALVLACMWLTLGTSEDYDMMVSQCTITEFKTAIWSTSRSCGNQTVTIFIQIAWF